MTTIKIGWTKGSDFWEYHPELERHWLEIKLASGGRETPQMIAEAVFEATNAPENYPIGALASEIRAKIELAGYRGIPRVERGGVVIEPGVHYSLSVGDVVQVGEKLLACERFGWKEVAA